jgi:hypothetical protein
MRLALYQVDAFTDRLFGGNPAAVVPLEQWLPDAKAGTLSVERMGRRWEPPIPKRIQAGSARPWRHRGPAGDPRLCDIPRAKVRRCRIGRLFF